MSPSHPSLTKRAVMGLLVAAVILGTVEGVLRWMWGPAPNPVQVYGALGAHDGFLDIVDGEVHRRYGEQPLPAFPQVHEGPRVGVLGGSSIHEGTPGLPPEEELPGLLANRLGVDVVNLGAPGLDSYDLLEITEALETVDFDALVVYTGHNDLGNAVFESRYGTLPSALYAYAYGGLSHLQLFSQLSRLLVPRTGTDRRTRPFMKPKADEIQPLDPLRRKITIRAFGRNLERIAWITQRRQQPLVLVVPVSDLTSWPQSAPCEPGHCPPDYFDKARAITKADPAAAIDILRHLKDQDPACVRAPTATETLVRTVAQQFPHVTLVDPFDALPKDPTFDIPNRALFIDPVHFSPEGHAALATVLEAPVLRALQAQADR